MLQEDIRIDTPEDITQEDIHINTEDTSVLEGLTPDQLGDLLLDTLDTPENFNQKLFAELLRRGANLNRTRALDWSGYDNPRVAPKHTVNALYLAAEWGRLEAVKALISHGAKVYPIKDNCLRAINAAAARGDAEIFNVLLEAIIKECVLIRARVKNGMVRQAVLNSKLENVKHLFHTEDDNSDVDISDAIKGQPDQEGILNTSTLHFAALGGNVDIVKILIEQHKMDMNAVNFAGETPLFLAVSARNLDVMQYLVWHGADCSIANTSQKTVFDLLKRAPVSVSQALREEESKEEAEASAMAETTFEDKAHKVFLWPHRQALVWAFTSESQAAVNENSELLHPSVDADQREPKKPNKSVFDKP